jgi:hypothetical protein
MSYKMERSLFSYGRHDVWWCLMIGLSVEEHNSPKSAWMAVWFPWQNTDWKQPGEERIYFAYRWQFIIKGSQGRTLRQWPWRRAAYRLAQLLFLHSPGLPAQGCHCFYYAGLNQLPVRKMPTDMCPQEAIYQPSFLLLRQLWVDRD